jgi:hypothetical protein
LSSIASIRDNTHNLLHKFNKDLDPAYLSHVLGLISSPDMREQANDVAFDYAVDLISEEIKSELQISKTVKCSLSRETLNLWPKHVSPKQRTTRFMLKLPGEKALTFNHQIMQKLLCVTEDEALKEILETDLGMQPVVDISPIERFKAKSIQLSLDRDSNEHLLELCSIENIRRDLISVGTHIPVLKQGTIIKNSSKDDFYVCIQPVCDSVRLMGPTSFTFLKVEQSNNNFSHVIRKSAGNYFKLNISGKPTTMRTFTFNADAELKVVQAIQDRAKFIFLDDSMGEGNSIHFEWCGEFKQAVSQSIVNNLAAQLSRVGLDSFEWLRQKQNYKLSGS